MIVDVVGVDPGLVHTGVICYRFDTVNKSVKVVAMPVAGPDAAEVLRLVNQTWPPASPEREYEQHIFIEDYRPRSHFNTDHRMTKAVSEMKNMLPGSKIINNTGVKKVIREYLLQHLKSHTFSRTTHHQDLRSAAYIALYGMVKNDKLNGILVQYAKDAIRGKEWYVSHIY